ncbi:MAG: alpha amylase C-terminal domain-containing protein [Bacteroidia bacterium]|nr:alpha amylase C-terminal domain-containing protein [Bacteroidia bacterium]
MKKNPGAKKTPKKKSIALTEDDPWLEPYLDDILARRKRCRDRQEEITKTYGSMRAFSKGHEYFGINYDAKAQGWWYREWAPAAERLSLVGDFNEWDKEAHILEKKEGGIWEIFLPKEVLKHKDKLKVHITAANGSHDRMPAYIKRAVQDPNTYDFAGQIWEPEKEFKWTDKKFKVDRSKAPMIYECHTGMAQEKEGVGSWKEFEENILPRIKKLGYNAIQMMAVQEHPYYGSFGYHVSNFFAPSSRFGTPEDLKSLINTAHKMGIAVIMDIVHSHAVKNFAEGLNELDGSDDHYFHSGGRGEHEGWDSKLFNYGKEEVQRFLLSNVAYWLEEFHFDGFRFDGVTSILYFHHGEHVSFDHYDKYFKEGAEWDAITYLQLANELIHEIRPDGISIAEDMSGMPGACRTVEEGGLGFDFRLAMGIPDYWIKILKHKQDEEWNIEEMWHTLNNRRYKEANIAYAESHDQALVGDKTLAFWLMDKEMYWHMRVDDQHPVIDRGIALHKLIRIFTATLGGEGYLNFIGNEFGHPEWIDFPREGNDWSYKYARRQWSLLDREDLKYQFLNNFDAAMLRLLSENDVLSALPAAQLNMDENNKVIIFERNNLIFVFNFSTSASVPDYKFFVPKAGKYKIVLNSDNKDFGGFERIDEAVEFFTVEDEHGSNQLSIYTPSRTVLVFKKEE